MTLRSFINTIPNDAEVIHRDIALLLKFAARLMLTHNQTSLDQLGPKEPSLNDEIRCVCTLVLFLMYCLDQKGLAMPSAATIRSILEKSLGTGSNPETDGMWQDITNTVQFFHQLREKGEWVYQDINEGKNKVLYTALSNTIKETNVEADRTDKAAAWKYCDYIRQLILKIAGQTKKLSNFITGIKAQDLRQPFSDFKNADKADFFEKIKQQKNTEIQFSKQQLKNTLLVKLKSKINSLVWYNPFAYFKNWENAKSKKTVLETLQTKTETSNTELADVFDAWATVDTIKILKIHRRDNSNKESTSVDKTHSQRQLHCLYWEAKLLKDPEHQICGFSADASDLFSVKTAAQQLK